MGSGKSTLSRLLLKFIAPTEGKVTISGYDIEDIDHSYLRSRIAYIPQNNELFTGTAIDNLRVGNSEASYEEMVLACKKAGASNLLRNYQITMGHL